MEITKTKRQVGPTNYGKNAEQWTRQFKHDTFEWNDNPNAGDHEIASPWATWTVEKTNGGWAVFVEEAM